WSSSHYRVTLATSPVELVPPDRQEVRAHMWPRSLTTIFANEKARNVVTLLTRLAGVARILEQPPFGVALLRRWP
ncbi:MAG: hypothetical protein LC749_13040, partial [Actinobacteria bacterium]|nr:hypothetical protein [Actinomycetota bacterium]